MNAETKRRLKNMELPIFTRKKTEEFAKKFFRSETKKIEKVCRKFGLTPVSGIRVEIVSAEEKYIFNYLSGAFGNKDLRKGAENFSKFLKDKRFLNRITRLSGRAIWSNSVVDSMLESLGYLEEIGYPKGKGGLVWSMKSLCRKIQTSRKAKKGVILLGFPKQREVAPFGNLLAHEVFHIVLMRNGIFFQEIDERDEYLDEALADMLYLFYSESRKDRALLDLIRRSGGKKEAKLKKLLETYKQR